MFESDPFLNDLDSFMKDFQPVREVSNGVHRLKIPDHHSIAFWPPKKRRMFRITPSGDLYEPVTTAVMSYLQHRLPIKTVYDIGASAGYFSFVAASFEGDRPNVYAFEMNPKFLAMMEGILAGETYAIGRLHPQLAGMSDRDLGERTVWHSLTRMYEEKPAERDYREAWWRRLKFALRGVHDRDRLIESRMSVTSIDAFAATHEIPDLIKIDVDGHEAKVIPGGMNTFRQHKPILLFELHKDERLKRFGSTREKLMSMLFDCGYRCVTFTNHHDCAKASIQKVTLDSAVLKRQKTDLFLLY